MKIEKQLVPYIKMSENNPMACSSKSPNKSHEARREIARLEQRPISSGFGVRKELPVVILGDVR